MAPSYDLKLQRAMRHLVDMEGLVAAYVNSHPYEVRVENEGGGRTYRLRFTAQPSEWIAIVLGDFLYNVHAALNHVATSLVTSKKGSVAFPIFWQGVWEPSIDGENKQRRDDRQRWTTYTARMPDGAVEILKRVQPENVPDGEESLSGLAVLNRLRNADAHTRLVVVSHVLVQPAVLLYAGDGQVIGGTAKGDPNEGLGEGGQLWDVPPEVTRVDIRGTPRVMVRFGRLVQDGGFDIRAFRHEIMEPTASLIEALRPFVRTN